MSHRLSAQWQRHRAAIQHSFQSLWLKPMCTVMTMMVLALGLTLPALFWAFTNSFSGMMQYWRAGSHVILYLDLGISTADQAHVLSLVRAHQQVGDATLKSPQDGLAELQQHTEIQDVLRSLPENPLPAVIDVQPAAGVQTPEEMQALSKQLQALPHVDMLKLDMDWVRQSHTLFHFLQKLTTLLMALFAITTLFIIGNTLRLLLQARHEEIEVLQLVGAPEAYILRPFLYLGVWYGLGGACVTLLLTQGFIVFFSDQLQQVYLLSQLHLPAVALTIGQVLCLLVVSSGLGWLAARLSVKRQLRV